METNFKATTEVNLDQVKTYNVVWVVMDALGFDNLYFIHPGLEALLYGNAVDEVPFVYYTTN